MKKLFTFRTIILLMVVTNLFAQNKQTPPNLAPYKVTWSQCFGGSDTDIGFSICEFDTSELLVASYTSSKDETITTPVFGNYDWWSMKFTHSTTPQLVWSYTYGGSNYDKNRQTVPSYNHKSYVLFRTTHSKDGDVDHSQLPQGTKDNWWLVKINDAGTILKQKLIVGAASAESGGRALLPTSDNGYICLGWSNAQDNDFIGGYGFMDGWLFKVDSNLNIQWRNHYGGSGTDAPIRLIRSGNYYYFTGETSSNNDDFKGQNHLDSTGHVTPDFGVWKTDTMGNLIWAKCPGGSGKEFPFDIHADWDGNIVCAGYTTSTDGDVTGYHGGSKDGWLFKLNASDGSLMWEKCFGGTSSDAIKRVLPMPDHGYLMLLTSASGDGDAVDAGKHQADDVWLLRIDSNLNKMYGKMFGGSGSDQALDMQEFPGQGYIILATSTSCDGDLQGVKSLTSGEDDWLFFVTDSSLFSSGTAMKASADIVKTPKAIDPTSIVVYPSITSGPISIQSVEPVSKTYTIRVVNTAGELVWSKIMADIKSPVNQNIDLSQNPKGTYFVQILYGDSNKETHKVTLE